MTRSSVLMCVLMFFGTSGLCDGDELYDSLRLRLNVEQCASDITGTLEVLDYPTINKDFINPSKDTYVIIQILDDSLALKRETRLFRPNDQPRPERNEFLPRHGDVIGFGRRFHIPLVDIGSSKELLSPGKYKLRAGLCHRFLMRPVSGDLEMDANDTRAWNDLRSFDVAKWSENVDFEVKEINANLPIIECVDAQELRVSLCLPSIRDQFVRTNTDCLAEISIETPRDTGLLVKRFRLSEVYSGRIGGIISQSAGSASIDLLSHSEIAWRKHPPDLPFSLPSGGVIVFQTSVIPAPTLKSRVEDLPGEIHLSAHIWGTLFGTSGLSESTNRVIIGKSNVITLTVVQ